MNQRPKEIDCGGKKCHWLVITFSMFARVIELTSWSIMYMSSCTLPQTQLTFYGPYRFAEICDSLR